MAKLYLLPSSLGGDDIDRITPNYNKALIQSIKYFACENIKSARRFLIACGLPSPIPSDIEFIEIRNDEDIEQLKHTYQTLDNGNDVCYLSEAGAPCVADPGEALASYAHHKNIKVIPLIGASSILLALMASGFNGELFTFNGYIPREKGERLKAIKTYYNNAKSGYTQIFMDTPYRNVQLLEDLRQNLPPNSKICVAINLSCENELIVSGEISQIKLKKEVLHKQPAMFLLA